MLCSPVVGTLTDVVGTLTDVVGTPQHPCQLQDSVLKVNEKEKGDKGVNFWDTPEGRGVFNPSKE